MYDISLPKQRTPAFSAGVLIYNIADIQYKKKTIKIYKGQAPRTFLGNSKEEEQWKQNGSNNNEKESKTG